MVYILRLTAKSDSALSVVATLCSEDTDLHGVELSYTHPTQRHTRPQQHKFMCASSSSCQVTKHVCVCRVGKEIQQVLYRALACDSRLHKVAQHRQHCQPPILDLPHGLVHKAIGVLAEPKGVKGSATCRVKCVLGLSSYGGVVVKVVVGKFVVAKEVAKGVRGAW